MMSEDKLRSIFVVGCLCLGITLSGIAYIYTSGDNNVVSDALDEYIESEGEPVWHTVFEYRPGLSPLGEATPTGGSGVVAVFLLDNAEDAFVVLADNTTDWSSDGTVLAYADSDGFSEDCPSEDSFNIVVRCRFTKAVCFDEGDNQFVANRTKCTITFSGDEAGTVTHYGNYTDGATGGGMPSENNSANASLWVNFWYEDADYHITDDGSLSIDSIVVSAKY